MFYQISWRTLRTGKQSSQEILYMAQLFTRCDFLLVFRLFDNVSTATIYTRPFTWQTLRKRRFAAP